MKRKFYKQTKKDFGIWATFFPATNRADAQWEAILFEGDSLGECLERIKTVMYRLCQKGYKPKKLTLKFEERNR